MIFILRLYSLPFCRVVYGNWASLVSYLSDPWGLSNVVKRWTALIKRQRQRSCAYILTSRISITGHAARHSLELLVSNEVLAIVKANPSQTTTKFLSSCRLTWLFSFFLPIHRIDKYYTDKGHDCNLLVRQAKDYKLNPHCSQHFFHHLHIRNLLGVPLRVQRITYFDSRGLGFGNSWVKLCWAWGKFFFFFVRYASWARIYITWGDKSVMILWHAQCRTRLLCESPSCLLPSSNLTLWPIEKIIVLMY